MRTNINLVKHLAKSPAKLWGHVFTKGDPVIYHHRHNAVDTSERQGIYISHRSISSWHNGIEYRNCNHLITIIDMFGKKTVVSWIKPINK